MLAIAVNDARHFIIPDELSIAGFALALVNALIERPDAAVKSVAFVVLRRAALAMLFLAVRLGYQTLRQREGIGLGDVKLAAVAGAWLGWLTIPIAVEIAAVAALTWYTARQIVRERSIERTNRLPFVFFLLHRSGSVGCCRQSSPFLPEDVSSDIPCFREKRPDRCAVNRLASSRREPIAFGQGGHMRKAVTALLAGAVVALTATNPAWPMSRLAGLDAYRRGDYAAAIRQLPSLAAHGNAEAQATLGFIYENGRGVPQNPAIAGTLYRCAAEQGNAAAQYLLGSCMTREKVCRATMCWRKSGSISRPRTLADTSGNIMSEFATRWPPR